MKKIFILLLLMFFLSNALNSKGRLNNPDNIQGAEQYGIFYINEKPPEYFEDWYLLYTKRMYYNEENIWVNIKYLLRALRAPFRHQSKALCLLKNKEQDKKYKYLMIMHVYLKIMQNYLTLGSLYDKKYIYFFNMPFKEDLIKSLNRAKEFYGYAGDFWKKVLKYAKEANKVEDKISMDFLENELYLILNRAEEVDWDYDYTINLHLTHLEENLKKLQKN